MARLKNLPSLEVIKGFKGVIDYAIYRGVPIARRWPRTPRDHLTAATLATAAVFGAVVAAFPLLASNLLDLLKVEAADQPRTARDIFVQAIYGKLHEAPKMIEIQEDDVLVTIADTINLEGEGVDVINEGSGKVTLNIPGAPPPTIEIQDEGVKVSDADTIDFVGAGVEASEVAPGKVEVYVPGADGAGPMSGAKATLSADQTIPNVTVTKLLLNTEIFDNLGDFNPATYSFTVPVSGKYFAFAQARFLFMPDQGLALVYIFKNGVDIADNILTMSGATHLQPTVSTILLLEEGDVLDLRVYQATAAPRNVAAGEMYTNLVIYQIP